jgi:putative membrane protein
VWFVRLPLGLEAKNTFRLRTSALVEANPPEPQELRPPDDSPVGPSRRTVLAAERTWLAWFRTGIGVSAAAIGVGAVLPKLADNSSWGYVVLGAGYAALAVGVFVEGWRRQREIYSAIATDDDVPTGINAIITLTIAGGLLALGTMVMLFTEI